MMKRMISIGLLAVAIFVAGPTAQAKGDNFSDVVKVIERLVKKETKEATAARAQ